VTVDRSNEQTEYLAVVQAPCYRVEEPLDQQADMGRAFFRRIARQVSRWRRHSARTPRSLSLAVESKADETSPWPDADVFARRIVNLERDRVRLAGISCAAVDFGRANTQEIWLDRRIRWTLALLESPEKSSFAT
jgi:hypothetical protein